jgi:hypothetical protein
MDKYNGWTNYETWRVNLEIFDGMTCEDIPVLSRYEEASTGEVATYLEEYAEEIIFDCEGVNRDSLVADYAQVFLNSVNWHEIAEHFVSEWNDLIRSEEEDEDEETTENEAK